MRRQLAEVMGAIGTLKLEEIGYGLRLMRTGEVLEALGVTKGTLRGMVRRGILRPVKQPRLKGQRRGPYALFRRAEVERLGE